MKLSVTSQDKSIGTQLHELVQRQIAYALGRFEVHIRSVTLRLSDLNGPKGGVDKHCKIMVTLRGGESIVAEVTDVEFEPVIHRAVDRIAGRVRRYLKASQTLSRSAAAARKDETGVGE